MGSIVRDTPSRYSHDVFRPRLALVKFSTNLHQRIMLRTVDRLNWAALAGRTLVTSQAKAVFLLQFAEGIIQRTEVTKRKDTKYAQIHHVPEPQ